MDFTEINSRGKRGELLQGIDRQNSRFRTAKTTIIKFGLHASFVELESAKRGKKPVSAEAIEKVALQVEEDKSSNVLASTSVRYVAEALDLPRSTFQKIMRNIPRYYPYKLQFVQELLPHDFEIRHLFSL
ncbi:uncharacterized protein TNCV_1543141 [Trichonephila clavipes]|nr:uncharacterized protein TNCV_1543141 [Trichonephila clavipes]